MKTDAEWQAIRDVMSEEYGKQYAEPYNYDATKAFNKGFDAARAIQGDGFSETERMEYLQKTLVLSVKRTVANNKQVASVGSRINELKSSIAKAVLDLIEGNYSDARETLLLAYESDQKVKENA